ncbi:MAG TPA: T9SS type A sorting domain-containing protein [Bacteroidales bacterium]|nr:T9SS type A sorting domain-containing protein [Bacteroidales bacterium]
MKKLLVLSMGVLWAGILFQIIPVFFVNNLFAQVSFVKRNDLLAKDLLGPGITSYADYQLIMSANSKDTKAEKHVLDSVIEENFLNGLLSESSKKRCFYYNQNGAVDSIIEFAYFTSEAMYRPSSKTVFIYSLNSTKLTEELLYYANENQDWIPGRKKQFLYSVDNMTFTIVMSMYLQETGEWTLFRKLTEEYNNDNNLVQSVLSWYDSNLMIWESQLKDEYMYHNSELVSYYLHSVWNSETEQWQGVLREDYDFDDEDRLLTHVSYNQGDQGILKFSSKEEYTYWNEGQICNMIQYSFLVDNWIQQEKDSVFINSERDSTIIYKQLWNSNLQVWKNSNKSIKTWIGNDYLIGDEFYVWNENQSGWSRNTKISYLYDSQWNIVVENKATWNSESQQWNMLSADSSFYDISCSLENLLLPFDYFDFTGKLMQIKNTVYLNNIPEVSSLSQFYYSIRNINYYEHPKDFPCITVFPNPSSGIFNIECKTTQARFELFDDLGRKVFTSELNQGLTETVKLLPGFYLYRVQSNDCVCFGKLVVN